MTTTGTQMSRLPLLLSGRGRMALMGKIGNVGFGAFSRIFALGSQFVVLVLLGKVLPKSDFGDFMIVFALTRVLSTGMGTGLATLLIYHISRNATEEMEYSLHRSVVAVGLLVAGGTSLALFLLAQPIADWFQKPGLVFWIHGMAPFTLFYTLLTISSGVFDGRGRITRSILASEFFPNLIRLIALPLLLFLHYGNIAVTTVMVASVLLPWLAIAYTLLRRLDAGFARLTGWDMQYAGKLTVHSFAVMQVQGIDMLVVGWLFTSTAAADYAIASRIAALIPFFQNIIVKAFMAKAGRAIHEHDTPALQDAVEDCRSSSTILVTLTAILALASFPVLLLIMGNFSSAMPLLAALAIGPIVRAYYPGADALLRIAGMANSSLAFQIAGCSSLILFPIIFAHSIGVYSLALGMFLASVILNPIVSSYLTHKLQVRLTAPSIWLPMALAIAATGICLMAGQNLPLWFAGVAVLCVSVVPTYLHRRRMRSSFQ